MDDFKQDLKNIDKKRLIQSLLVLFILITIPLSIYLGQQSQVFAPKAQTEDDIQVLTNKLLELKKDSEETSFFERVGIAADLPVNLTKMISTATIRKAALLKEAETNPQAFLDHATLVDQKSSFPTDVQPFLEDRIQAQGELIVIHADDFENSRSVFLYKLKEGGNLYDLSFVSDPPQLLTGSVVEVNGTGLDSDIVIQSGAEELPPESPPITPPPFRVLFPIQPLVEGTTGTQETVVLLVNFDDNPVQPVSVDQIRQIMFDPTGTSALTYYRENSFNQTYFQGDVFGWYTIPGTGDCEDWDWAIQADEAASAAGVDINSYQRIVYVSPASNCPYGGWGTIGGNPSRSWIYRPERFGIYLHELGHNLGVHHANFLLCNEQPPVTIPIPSIEVQNEQIETGVSDCFESEYGDPYDVMGNDIYRGNYYHFNAPHKEALHWIPPHKVQIASGSATYRIFNQEEALTGPQALKIFKPDTFEYYFVSFRKAIGFDATLPKEVTSGVAIHIWNENPTRQTVLIDPTPQAPSFTFNNLMLTDGTNFRDQVNGIEIKQLSHDNISATVEVRNAAEIPRVTIQGNYVDENGNSLRLPNHTTYVSSQTTGYSGSSVTSPNWFFSNLLPGIYKLSAVPTPGYEVYYSLCSGCAYHYYYAPGNSFDYRVSPDDGFLDISFKYVPAGSQVELRPSPFPVLYTTPGPD